MWLSRRSKNKTQNKIETNLDFTKINKILTEKGNKCHIHASQSAYTFVHAHTESLLKNKFYPDKTVDEPNEKKQQNGRKKNLKINEKFKSLIACCFFYWVSSNNKEWMNV